MTVFNIVGRLALESSEELLGDFPGELSLDDLRAATEYCSRRVCEDDHPTNYCEGCSLRRRHEGGSFEEYVKNVETTDHHRPGASIIFLGTEAELRAHWEGRDAWLIAERIRAERGWT
jgi:hypothetical protein